MVVLATAATVIASQAVISGAFSVSRQAMQLGFLPPLRIRQTSEEEGGQIYLPAVNLILFLGVIALLLIFRSSTKLATAYGIAVTATLADHDRAAADRRAPAALALADLAAGAVRRRLRRRGGDVLHAPT